MRYVCRSFSSLIVATGLLHSVSAHAQAPTPFELASQLDLECRSAQGAPPAAELGIRQLNPVLQGVLPNQKAQLGPLEEVCVPVAKNNDIPTEPARRFIRAIDLACYKAEAPPVDVRLVASHLNPVLAELPDEAVHLVQLQQICVPVAKNGVIPPEPMLSVARHMDFGCYGLEEPTSDANRNLLLSHLNPVLVQQGLPSHVVQMERARQLCVPIGKNQEPIPDGVRERVRWVDFLKYRVTPVAGPLAPWPLTLSHLNPLFAEKQPFNVTLFGAPRLLVPIAKNGVIPPGGGD
jgi:hypothetical protein